MTLIGYLLDGVCSGTEDVGSDHLLIYAELGHNQIVGGARISYPSWRLSNLKGWDSFLDSIIDIC